MKKSFEYKGIKFKAYRNLKDKSNTFEDISLRIKDVGVTPEAWDYDEFYKIAGKNDCVFDLYKISHEGKDIIVIPGKNYLFKYGRLGAK
ncbi:hypothetical protein BFS06_11510 [Clostridium perfringens]|uniref:hypothetical protein n=1 Tax=Clostridium perfringens TaxID=1502 RepID=UPI001038DF1E|nr:hypothetical protein [Clostridium perfringens]TBX14841.1 hypothetical protein BFS06_11510 [Clostridium perfringens]